MATEMESLKMKKQMKKATPAELKRLKELQDGEPLSTADLEEAKRREEERGTADKAAFAAKHKTKDEAAVEVPADTSLDTPAEHPRILQIKFALLPFTRIEADDSRPDDFVLFTRGVKITAGDVRNARKAMKL